jgi:SAM-dependent methyltransferase
MKDSFPQLDLVGIDLNADAIEECKKTKELEGIEFFIGSALELRDMFRNEFDLIVANAMVHPFSQNEFKVAIKEFASALKPTGQLWAFDGFHPFNQEIEIIERSVYGSEQGIPIHYRSYSGVRDILDQAGFESVEFQPFEMPFDLQRIRDDFTTLMTHTVKTEAGTRLSMRGSIFQPWCHLFAKRKLI